MKRMFVCVAALLGFGLLIGGNEAGDDKPKFTISEIMKKQMKTGNFKKLEKAEAVEVFTALSKNKPPKGEADSWKSKTEALIAAAKEGDEKKLAAAAMCTTCHKAHR